MLIKQLLFVGLGNPGKKYELTRHNLGELVLRAFARKHGITLKEERKFYGFAAKGLFNKVGIHLLVPTTYMNESGRAVRAYMEFYKLSPGELVVLCDDVAIPFGEFRLRSFGSSGGHNGLKSIASQIGGDQFARLRLGIGADRKASQDLADFVLDTFSQEELSKLPETLERGAEVMKSLTVENIATVMNAVNGKQL